MGVSRNELPKWDDIQFVVGQLHKLPLLDEEKVGTDVVIGANAGKPLLLDIPLFVSDMSFGALSEEAKIALAKGAELAGTGICSGEGGMLPEEQVANSRYFYELASARFGFSWDKVQKTQAFHFKGGQGAKTGTGGHLPGNKVKGKIAEVRELHEGDAAISPARFPDWTELSQYKDFAAEVRDKTGGIPVGFKLSAQHIEKDIDAALDIGVDYIILDGRGGGTGAAPLIFRDNISVPTIPALASQLLRCRRRYARDNRWLASPCRFRKSNGARGRCDSCIERCNSGDRLCRYACLPHEQLPGRYCDAKTAPSRAFASRYRCRTPGQVFPRLGGFDVRACQGRRPSALTGFQSG
jgi:hypothetical protein